MTLIFPWRCLARLNTATTLISVNLTKVKENHLRCFYRSPSLQSVWWPWALEEWQLCQLNGKSFLASCNSWLSSFLGTGQEMNLLCLCQVNEGQECSQGNSFPDITCSTAREVYSDTVLYWLAPGEALTYIFMYENQTNQLWDNFWPWVQLNL